MRSASLVCSLIKFTPTGDEPVIKNLRVRASRELRPIELSKGVPHPAVQFVLNVRRQESNLSLSTVVSQVCVLLRTKHRKVGLAGIKPAAAYTPTALSYRPIYTAALKSRRAGYLETDNQLLAQLSCAASSSIFYS